MIVLAPHARYPAAASLQLKSADPQRGWSRIHSRTRRTQAQSPRFATMPAACVSPTGVRSRVQRRFRASCGARLVHRRPKRANFHEPTLLLSEVRMNVPIDHVVVMVMENRSLDHLLGNFTNIIPGLQGLQGNETNPGDPQRPAVRAIPATVPDAYTRGPDPGHEPDNVAWQLFGIGA